MFKRTSENVTNTLSSHFLFLSQSKQTLVGRKTSWVDFITWPSELNFMDDFVMTNFVIGSFNFPSQVIKIIKIYYNSYN